MALKLTKLLPLIEELPAYHRVLEELRRQNANTRIALLDAAKPYFIAALHQDLSLPMLLVTAQPKNSAKLYEQLSTWSEPQVVKFFPEPDALPYESVVSDTSTELERLQALSALTSPIKEAPLIITCASALVQKIPPYHDITSFFQTIKTGMEIEPEKLLSQWQQAGYRFEYMVEVPGSVSRRGGIIDIYPPTSPFPARLEFFGNTIDSIRFFDPQTQRSVKVTSSVTIGPATEFLTPLMMNKAGLEELIENINLNSLNAEMGQQFREDLSALSNGEELNNIQFYAPLFNQDSILSYLPSKAILVLDEVKRIKEAIADLTAEAEELRTEKLKRGELPSNFPTPYFTWQELELKLKESQRLTLTAWDTAANTEMHRLNFTPAPSYAGQLISLTKKVKQLLSRKLQVILVSQQASRLSELLEEKDIIASPLTELSNTPPPSSLTLLQGSLASGWVMNETSHLFTDSEIFGFKKEQRFSKKRPLRRHKLFIELIPGDYLVHIEHGIARFAGVTIMSQNEVEKEYLVLKYAAGDKLYVPTDQIDRVNRYIGSSDLPPVLSRLGTQEWRKTKQKTREAIEAIAEELLNLYASREITSGFAFSLDSVWQQELEASFPYVETPDQMEVQKQVKGDMEKAKPMDRLVCGDVGYGKTEVAIRAAFKTVMDNKQVTVLVPTTVLAQQHLSTFSQRLGAFPIRIEVLSRFKTPKEQQDIISGLKSGQVDICIGTHRLLQKDVAFKDLGLLIIDEEQRFGVDHKEHLKQMRQEVDVLTLSATPIPRTLQMSLTSIRDMSTMETPPEDRLPIKTYVAEYSDRLVREAILRELERNGQVFFVHNRVQSIAFVASKLESIVPEAKIAIAHGQMPEADLEQVMADFSEGKTDILVCTTIIESGLDMPNVNTLIINNADKFGLTQLYQLRGRVGRGAKLAYAYFLYEKEKRLTSTAEKRLKTIFEATELGAGFSIAMKDLEIRGAGNLLGTRQSGHISAVGFSLYCQLLGEAVDELKAKRAGKVPKPPRLPEPTIDLPFDTLIPEEYVPDLETRLSLYQNLAKLNRIEQIEAQVSQFDDRFGAPPKEVENLLYAIKIKLLAAKAGFESISIKEGQIILSLLEGLKFSKKQRELTFREGVKMGSSQLILNLKQLSGKWQEVLEEVLKKIG